MPRRSRGRFLAGAGALLAVCAGGAGCQTRSVRPEAAIPYAAAAPAAAQQQRSFFRRPDPAPAYADARPAGRIATMLRPVPLDGGEVASAWQPVQRVSAEQVVAAPAPAAAPVQAAAPGALPVVTRAAIDMTPTPDGVPLPPLRTASDTSRPVPIASTGPAMSETFTGRDATDVPGPPLTPAAPRLVPQPAGGPVATLPTVLPPHPTPNPLPPHPAGPPVPKEFYKQSLPTYVVEPPDILVINASAAITLPTQPLIGQHLVRPDGSIGLGIYGSVFVAGMTLDQITNAVAAALQRSFQQIQEPEAPKSDEPPDAKRRDELKAARERVKEIKALTVEQIRMELQVDVLAYNSKFYYVITDGGGYGEQVFRIPATGNETVLDAISQINGLPAVASKKLVWVARATPNEHAPNILPVDWCGIAQRGEAATNYQVFPGDRIYVNSDRRIRADSWLGKTLAPVERVLGTTLLGSSVVNSIKNRNGTGGQ
jgi:polysaccharide biosynthesis/export protein